MDTKTNEILLDYINISDDESFTGEPEECICNARHDEDFIKSLFNSFNDREHLDLVFLFDEGEIIEAHKVVFVSISSYIKDMILLSGQQDVVYISIPNVQHKYMKILTDFLYSGIAELSRKELYAFNELMQLLGISIVNINATLVNTSVISHMVREDEYMDDGCWFLNETGKRSHNGSHKQDSVEDLQPPLLSPEGAARSLSEQDADPPILSPSCEVPDVENMYPIVTECVGDFKYHCPLEQDAAQQEEASFQEDDQNDDGDFDTTYNFSSRGNSPETDRSLFLEQSIEDSETYGNGQQWNDIKVECEEIMLDDFTDDNKEHLRDLVQTTYNCNSTADTFTLNGETQANDNFPGQPSRQRRTLRRRSSTINETPPDIKNSGRTKLPIRKEQTVALEKAYSRYKYPTTAVREKLANSLGLTLYCVTRWFALKHARQGKEGDLNTRSNKNKAVQKSKPETVKKNETYKNVMKSKVLRSGPVSVKDIKNSGRTKLPIRKEQTVALEKAYSRYKYPTTAIREKLANSLGLTLYCVTRWFALKHARQGKEVAAKPALTSSESVPQKSGAVAKAKNASKNLDSKGIVAKEDMKTVRHFTVFTEKQAGILKKTYSQNKYPSIEDQRKFAHKFHVSESSIINWFKNRRAKEKRDKVARFTRGSVKRILSRKGKLATRPEAPSSRVTRQFILKKAKRGKEIRIPRAPRNPRHVILEQRFKENNRPDNRALERIANELECPVEYVVNWFTRRQFQDKESFMQNFQLVPLSITASKSTKEENLSEQVNSDETNSEKRILRRSSQADTRAETELEKNKDKNMSLKNPQISGIVKGNTLHCKNDVNKSQEHINGRLSDSKKGKSGKKLSKNVLTSGNSRHTISETRIRGNSFLNESDEIDNPENKNVTEELGNKGNEKNLSSPRAKRRLSVNKNTKSSTRKSDGEQANKGNSLENVTEGVKIKEEPPIDPEYGVYPVKTELGNNVSADYIPQDKRKNIRHRFANDPRREILENIYCKTRYPDTNLLRETSANLKLDYKFVSQWFASRRHQQKLNAKRKSIKRWFANDPRREILENIYRKSRYPDTNLLRRKCARLKLDYKFVSQWFATKRCKEKLNGMARSSHSKESSAPSTSGTLKSGSIEQGDIKDNQQVSMKIKEEPVDIEDANTSIQSYSALQFDIKREKGWFSRDPRKQYLEQLYKENQRPDLINLAKASVELDLPRSWICQWFATKRWEEKKRETSRSSLELPGPSTSMPKAKRASFNGSSKNKSSKIKSAKLYSNLRQENSCTNLNKSNRPPLKTGQNFKRQNESGKTIKPKATVISKFQREKLLALYKKNSYPDIETRKRLGKKIGLEVGIVHQWFATRRYKENRNSWCAQEPLSKRSPALTKAETSRLSISSNKNSTAITKAETSRLSISSSKSNTAITKAETSRLSISSNKSSTAITKAETSRLSISSSKSSTPITKAETSRVSISPSKNNTAITKAETSRLSISSSKSSTAITEAETSRLSISSGCDGRTKPAKRTTKEVQHEEAVHKLYSCDECGAKMGYKSNLTRHFLLHTGEKSYQCKTCKKTFMYHQQLKDHTAQCCVN